MSCYEPDFCFFGIVAGTGIVLSQNPLDILKNYLHMTVTLPTQSICCHQNLKVQFLTLTPERHASATFVLPISVESFYCELNFLSKCLNFSPPYPESGLLPPVQPHLLHHLKVLLSLNSLSGAVSALPLCALNDFLL